jgi:hypothetical protein
VRSCNRPLEVVSPGENNMCNRVVTRGASETVDLVTDTAVQFIESVCPVLR